MQEEIKRKRGGRGDTAKENYLLDEFSRDPKETPPGVFAGKESQKEVRECFME